VRDDLTAARSHRCCRTGLWLDERCPASAATGLGLLLGVRHVVEDASLHELDSADDGPFPRRSRTPSFRGAAILSIFVNLSLFRTAPSDVLCPSPLSSPNVFRRQQQPRTAQQQRSQERIESTRGGQQELLQSAERLSRKFSELSNLLQLELRRQRSYESVSSFILFCGIFIPDVVQRAPPTTQACCFYHHESRRRRQRRSQRKVGESVMLFQENPPLACRRSSRMIEYTMLQRPHIAEPHSRSSRR